jgi:hypothetical protein
VNFVNYKSTIKKLKSIIWIIALGALIGLGYFSLKQYRDGQAELGIIICNEGECIKTLHIHANIEFDLCGETHVLAREAGELSGLHTHKEKNRLHFHNQLKLDSNSKATLPDERLSIRQIMKGYELDTEMTCQGENPAITVLVNGQEPNEKLDYNWQDGDQIKLIFK